jgi:hypothetical protein
MAKLLSLWEQSYGPAAVAKTGGRRKSQLQDEIRPTYFRKLAML